MSEQKISVEAVVAAPIELVWETFTTPADIKEWNFASDDWCCPGAIVDLRVGGTYKARMEAKDGSFGFDFDGVYEEVEPHRAVTLAMPDGRRARTTFEPCGDGIKVTTVFDAETQNAVDMQRDGWQSILDNFASHVRRKRQTLG
ncbi:SRPBCC family protein [Roseomonas sp. HF4]|uniref:SRPBCC family protein n=1 Tax=Roseomonas sp. HF4 TaxID=2562313 RepID=UPI0010BF8EDF|nr:SRPBCC family protein [Roseomonas sp. HF4]